MNVLIVFAHHEPQSFNAAMKDLAVSELDLLLRPIQRGMLGYVGLTVLPPFIA